MDCWVVRSCAIDGVMCIDVGRDCGLLVANSTVH